MSKKLPLIRWREKLQDIIPKNNRIGDDLLLVDDKYWDPGDEPFIADITYSIILTRGWSDLDINMRHYHVEAPAIIVILPGMITQIKGSSEEHEGFSMIMSQNFFDPIFNDLSINTALNNNTILNPVSKIDYPEVFIDYKNMLKRILISDGCIFKIEAARHLTMTMLYGYTLSLKKLSTPIGANRNDEIANRFLDLVQKHFGETRDVASYAGMLCITPKYLAMAVKSSTGETPLVWIEKYTNSAAKAMLASKKLNVNEISKKLNFSSQALFGKFFKRVNGISPRDYRKQLLDMDKTSNI